MLSVDTMELVSDCDKSRIVRTSVPTPALTRQKIFGQTSDSSICRLQRDAHTRWCLQSSTRLLLLFTKTFSWPRPLGRPAAGWRAPAETLIALWTQWPARSRRRLCFSSLKYCILRRKNNYTTSWCMHIKNNQLAKVAAWKRHRGTAAPNGARAKS